MASTTIPGKLTNGVSFGLKHTVSASDAANKAILFDFGVDYDLVPSLQIKSSTNALKALTGLRITRPAKGQILLDEGITDAVAEVSTVKTLANTTVAAEAEVTEVTLVANTSGSLNGKYFTISSPTVDYYVWFSTDGIGVDPAVADHTGINVDLPAGDSTDAEVAAAVEAVLDAYGTGIVFDTTAVDEVLTVTNLVEGAATDATAGDSGVSINITNQGVDADTSDGTLNGKYFLISSPTVNYYVWYSTNGTGVDPAVASRTGINVDLPAGDSTDAEVAAATETVLDALGTGLVFDTDAVDEVLTITNLVEGAATDVAAGDSGFTVEVVTQGVTYADASTFDFAENDVIEMSVFRDYQYSP